MWQARVCPYASPGALSPGLSSYPGVIMACPDDHLTGAEAASEFSFHRTWCNTQRTLGKLERLPCKHYRYRDVQKLEAECRKSGMVLRGRRAQYQAA